MKKLYLFVEDGEIASCLFEHADGLVEVEVEDDFDELTIFDYELDENNELVFNEDKHSENARAKQQSDQSILMEEMMKKNDQQVFLLNLDDEQASKIPLMYPSWNDDPYGYVYKIDERREYNEVLYKCLQSHDKQINREPDKAVSLWVKTYTEKYPQWVQPTGAHDAYGKGDGVTYNGVKYESLIDANVWSPDDYPSGWSLVE